MKKITIALTVLLALGFLAVILHSTPKAPQTPVSEVTSTSTPVAPTASSTPVETPPAHKAPTPPQPIVPKAPAPVAPKPLDSFNEAMLADMNAARAAAGLQPLVENSELDSVAEDKLVDEDLHNSFSHIGSDGQMSWHWFTSEGYAYKWAGENLADGYADDEPATFTAYMNSPEHRANILDANYTEVGLADDATSTRSVVEFGSRQ